MISFIPHSCSSEEFFQGGNTRGFFQNVSRGGPKRVKFDFSLLKLRKQPFLLKFSNSGGAKAPSDPPLPTPTSALVVSLKRWCFSVTWLSILPKFCRGSMWNWHLLVTAEISSIAFSLKDGAEQTSAARQKWSENVSLTFVTSHFANPRTGHDNN